MNVTEVSALSGTIRQEISKVVVGQDELVDVLVVALLCQGHVLVEGVPGTAKTLLSRTLAACLDMEFKRIQFTPDLMPGDVIGTNLFDFRTNQFTLTKGPVFTDFLLADEINRTPPKTQSALLQAMQEREVTLDGTNHALPQGFFVVATQNPIEQEGTYPLPEAQLDRFLFKVHTDYPGRTQERDIVLRHGMRTAMPQVSDFGVGKVADPAVLARAREAIAALHLADELVDYLVDLVRATRQHSALLYGASPRSSAVLAMAARAGAALAGRDYVIPDDIKGLFLPAMRHRVVLAPGAELEGQTADGVLEQVIASVSAPR